MIKQYRKKPVVIEAVQWTGENLGEIIGFFQSNQRFHLRNVGGWRELYVYTLEGQMLASIGDYIIKGVKGEFYPCKPDVFEATYEEVSNEH